jgi:DNA (cytosine-5)-methyltransferase 1
MLRVIREIKPKWIVGENVAGIVSWSDGLVFQEVHTDLETEGYSVQAVVLPAAGVNAPHRRDRIWFVAYADMADTNERTARPSGASAKAEVSGSGNNDEQESGGEQAEQHFGHGDVYGATTNTNIGTNRSLADDRSNAANDNEQGQETRQPGRGGSNGNDANAVNTRLQGRQDDRSAGGSRSQRNQQPPRLLCTTWDEFPTQPPIRKRDDGLSSQLVGITVSKHRNESIKAYGNAIVPQVALQIFKAINEYENQQ